MTRIYACSSNPGKLREFGLMASELGLADIELLPLPDLSAIPPPEETGSTFEANAAQKAVYYSQFTAEMVLADDSGIELDALAGAPGIFSARYAGTGATSQANNELLLLSMQGKQNRTARFICAVALARAGDVKHVVRGSVEGELLDVANGGSGFGYDPLFRYPPFACSFGELDDARKFSVSHRGNALRKIFAWLSENQL